MTNEVINNSYLIIYYSVSLEFVVLPSWKKNENRPRKNNNEALTILKYK